MKIAFSLFLYLKLCFGYSPSFESLLKNGKKSFTDGHTVAMTFDVVKKSTNLEISNLDELKKEYNSSTHKVLFSNFSRKQPFIFLNFFGNNPANSQITSISI